MANTSTLVVTLAAPAALLAGWPAGAIDDVLDDDDRAHGERLRFDADRAEARASRLLQRLALSHAVGDAVAPAAWRFAAAPGGRPRVSAPRQLPAGLAFSVANTRGLVGCAVWTGPGATDAALGFDLEAIPAVVPAEVLPRCFTVAEIAALRELPPDAQPARFAAMWTIKEAYLKARGLGLAAPLDRFAVGFGADDDERGAPTLVIDPELDDDGGRWRVVAWREAGAGAIDHAAALCLAEGAAALVPVVRWLSPGATACAGPGG